ncbi:DUF1127 domain-containing protein [Candidatus Pantoea persica]|nr:DUF1127 domain-containing protein [Candidatus Pantoea persica]MBA2814244.1 hypothetical protein [Candidatus Pantoea persica]
MGYEEKCAAKPFSVTPWQLLRAAGKGFRRLLERHRTPLMLSRLSDE